MDTKNFQVLIEKDYLEHYFKLRNIIVVKFYMFNKIYSQYNQ